MSTLLTGNTSLPIGATGTVVYNWNPATQLQNWIAAETAVANGVPGAQAKIIAFGDSTTSGVGAGGGQSYPDDLATALAQDSGISVQENNYNGDMAEALSTELSFVGGGGFNYGLNAAGGAMAQLGSAGQGVVWTPASSGSANRLDISYWDNGGGTVTVTATGGPNGSFSQTLQLGNGGNMLTQTIDLPAGSYSKVSVVSSGANPAYIEGMSLWDTQTPAIQVINAGEGGAWASVVGNGQSTGTGEFPGGIGLKPNLALIDYGINDILNNTYTAAQTVANIALAITECRANGCDPVIVIPEPFGLDPTLPNTLSSISQLITGLEALSLQMNVPIIDLNSTYGNSPTSFASSNLIGFGVHPGAAGYADIAARIASVLTNSPQSYSNSAGYVVPGAATVTGTSGNDILFSTATSNTLVGGGGTDTYLMNPNDQTDTIVNGAGGAASGQLDVMAANHNQLWLQRSGNDLVVEILGTARQTVVHGWYASAGAQLQAIVGSDGAKVTGIQTLVQAMATFAAANPGFNPATTAHVTLSDSYFGSTLAAATASAWGGATTPPVVTPPVVTPPVVTPPVVTPPVVTPPVVTPPVVTPPVVTPPVVTPPVVTPPAGTPTITLGSGPDTLALAINEDAYLGNAQFTVSVNGTQIGGTQTTTAIAGNGQSQTFDVLGTFSGTSNTATVNFLNDAWAGTPQTDRNLYVTGATINGTSIAGAVLNEYGPGPQSFSFQNPNTPVVTPPVVTPPVVTPPVVTPPVVTPPVVTPPAGTPTITLGSGPDTLALAINEDYYLGNAQFTVSVNGTQIGGTQTTTAIAGNGQSQTFDVQGTFSGASNTATVNFLNDAWAGTPQTDRNLYVTGATIDGTAIAGAVLNEHGSGPQSFSFQNPGSPVVTPPVTPPPTTTLSTLQVGLSEDAYLGNAMFSATVDGISQGPAQTVTALHSQGGNEMFNLASIGVGTHDIAISFLNDAWAGTPATDRNLYVDSLYVNGAAVPNTTAGIYGQTTQHFSVVIPS